jgi:hypothetical protein
MPQYSRDRSGAVVIRYSKGEIEDHLGYRILKLEKRVEELERVLKEVAGVVLYLKGGEKKCGEAVNSSEEGFADKI